MSAYDVSLSHGDGVGASGRGGVRMRGLLWGPVVHVSLGGSTEGALPSRRPARHQVGTSSVAAVPLPGGGEGTPGPS